MKPLIYNIAMLTGLALIAGGVAMVNIPTALVTVGTLVIALTMFGAHIGRKG